MTSRSRYSKSQWDPMKEDYENSTYEPQYPDDDVNGGVQLDHCKLYVKNISQALNENGLKAAFEKYATNVQVFLSRNPSKRFAIVSFDSPGEARLAMMKLNKTEPLKLKISIAHMKKNNDLQNPNVNRRPLSNRDRSDSSSNRQRSRKQEEPVEVEMLDENVNDVDLDVEEDVDTASQIEQESLKLKYLELQAEQIKCKQRIIQLSKAGKKSAQKSPSNRCIYPDGRIVVTNEGDRVLDNTLSSGGGDTITSVCSCDRVWNEPALTNADVRDQVKYTERYSASAITSIDRQTDLAQTVDITKNSEEVDRVSYDHHHDHVECDDGGDESDETDRLIQLRHVDYMYIVDDHLKIIVALTGYPKNKMTLKHMESFQECLKNIIKMQSKAGLLKKTPTFLDYYLNRGAIVCICKDVYCKDWMLRIYPGLQERMACDLMLLKSKVKRLCPGVIKIPKTCYTSTYQEVIKLLQYFNPTLKTHLWKTYAQKAEKNANHVYFTIDRVSSEMVRGQNFRNIVDYKQMEFEVDDSVEFYYDSYLTYMEDDLSSVASRVKLLEEIKSDESTPRMSNDSIKTDETCKLIENDKIDTVEETFEAEEVNRDEEILDVTVNRDDLENVSKNMTSDIDMYSDKYDEADVVIGSVSGRGSGVDASVQSESLDSTNVSRCSSRNASSDRGIAYNRRTNYLHIDNDLKIALVSEGYPQNKLDGTHIRHIKSLYKDILVKDKKAKRFQSLVVPKFQDVYLSNGAVVYICDSVETKKYLKELLPKFTHSMGLKLAFREASELLRYTRVVMKVPKEFVHMKSYDILLYFRDRFPNIKLELWKTYSDVSSKQKRQFGVDPESLEVLKSEDFDAIYEGKTIEFKIIDRKRNLHSLTNTEHKESPVVKLLKDQLLQHMYNPIVLDANVSLARTRANHYSDFVDDDLKLYIGPVNYPATRIDDILFDSIKSSIENIVFSIHADDFKSIPVVRDIYLFDGVIFIICKNMTSRVWFEKNIRNVNNDLNIRLKTTEFRGAVGIVTMAAETYRSVEDITNALQTQNPRLRTKFWRVISKVQTRFEGDVVLQIDRLSAQVINDANFNGTIDGGVVKFKLGHLKSLLKPKLSVDDPESPVEITGDVLRETDDIVLTEKVVNNVFMNDKENDENVSNREINTFIYTIDNKPDKSPMKSVTDNDNYYKVIMKVPTNILHMYNDCLDIILDLLEDKNPGLNTELWKVESRSLYHRGKFTISIDKKSASVITHSNFDPTLGGERLKFLF